jgi:hypothetical protein
MMAACPGCAGWPPPEAADTAGNPANDESDRAYFVYRRRTSGIGGHDG